MAKTPPSPPKPMAPPAGAKPIPSAPRPIPAGLTASSTSGKPSFPPPASKSASTATQIPAPETTSTKPVSSSTANIAGTTNEGRSQKTPSSVSTSTPDTAADLNGNARDTKKDKIIDR